MQVSLRPGDDFRWAAVLTFGIWGLVYLAYCATELLSGRTGFVADLPYDVPAVMLVAAVVLPIYPLLVALADRPAWVRWAALGVSIVVVAAVQAIINLLENRLLGVVPALDPAYATLIRERFLRNFQHHLYLSFACAALMLFQVELRRSAEARLAADRAKAAALRFQLNPHFMFNALNAVSSLIVTRRPDEADEMLGRLSDFLRASLRSDPDRLVTLDEELEAVAAYLELEAVRFRERLIWEMDVERGLGDARVPSFILQPLVENAVKYGAAVGTRPVTIRISAKRSGETLFLRVEDDGAGVDPARPKVGFGVGLSNIRQRLKVLYGERGRLDAGPVPTGGFGADIRLPIDLG